MLGSPSPGIDGTSLPLAGLRSPGSSAYSTPRNPAPLRVPIDVVYVDADNDEKSAGGVFGIVTAPLVLAGDNGGFRMGLAAGGGGGSTGPPPRWLSRTLYGST